MPDCSELRSLVVGVGTPSRELCSDVLGAKAMSSVEQIVRPTQNPDVLSYRGTQRRPRLDMIELQERPRPAALPVRRHE
jgi:hypothetical protein